MSEPIYGLLSFPAPLHCAKETLGARTEISIGGVKGSFQLPLPPEWKPLEDDPLGKFLVPPKRAKTWKRGDKPLFWGRPRNYPKGDAEVHQALMVFLVGDDKRPEARRSIFAAFGHWIELFDIYVALLTRRDMSRSSVSSMYNSRLELPSFNKNRGPDRAHDLRNPVLIQVSLDDPVLNRDQFRRICRWCSSGKRPSLEYRLMFEAYQAWNKQDYRKAVIESATAAEVALTKRLTTEFKKRDIDFGEGLLDRFRTLGGIFELVRLLGITLPTKDYKQLLIEPRNKVAHKANFPTSDIAKTVITTTEELLVTCSSAIAE